MEYFASTSPVLRNPFPLVAPDTIPYVLYSTFCYNFGSVNCTLLSLCMPVTFSNCCEPMGNKNKPCQSLTDNCMFCKLTFDPLLWGLNVCECGLLVCCGLWQISWSLGCKLFPFYIHVFRGRCSLYFCSNFPLIDAQKITHLILWPVCHTEASLSAMVPIFN